MPTLETIRTEASTPRAEVLLVHGAWHGAWCWQDGFAQRLADHGVSSVAVSLRGHGGSDGRDRLNRHRLRHYVDDVAAVLDGFDRPPVVAGHSMGGGVVQHLLARTQRPPLAGAALLASMPPAGVWRITSRVARQTPGTFVMTNLTRDLGRLVARPEQVQELFLSNDAPRDLVEALTGRVQSESFLAFLDMLVLDRPHPRPVDTPVLVVGAAEDRIFSAAEVAATARAWHTSPVTVDGLAHDVMLDVGWEQVADLLADWVVTTAG